MDIFESLENLNVSEECFEDIVGLVEEIINETVQNQIRKVHGGDLKKAYKLLDAADTARILNLRQFKGSKQGGKAVWDDYPKYAPKTIGQYGTPLEIPGHRATKNAFGMSATSQRTSNSRKNGQPIPRVKDYGLYPIPSDEEAFIATNKSITRHKAKQEKNKQK